jgi:hypothetical protein
MRITSNLGNKKVKCHMDFRVSRASRLPETVRKSILAPGPRLAAGWNVPPAQQSTQSTHVKT